MKKQETQEKLPRKGQSWMHPMTGTIYKFDGKNWVPINKKPYGPDPYGLINNHGVG